MSWSTALYYLVSRAAPLVARRYLQRRLLRGKEHPVRWPEKLGQSSAQRPDGRLIWMNAVGLGEVLALRGLINALLATDPKLSFLITSSGRSSVKVLAENMPPRTVHQFLPLDAPQYISAFLQHWRPDLSIWIEQDLWPNAVFLTAQRKIPLVYLNARLTARGAVRRARFHGLYAKVLRQFSLITAQDAATAQIIQQFGVACPPILPSLKRSAPVLAFDEKALNSLSAQTKGRKMWLVASSHLADEAAALPAHLRHLQRDPSALLVIVPRDPKRGPQIAQFARDMGLSVALRSEDSDIVSGIQVYIADGFGELGLWYRLCPVALIGGTFGETEGHNPWEAAKLGAAILHGPRFANFKDEFAQLSANKAALRVTPQDLDAQLIRDHSKMAQRGQSLALAEGGQLIPIAARIMELLP